MLAVSARPSGPEGRGSHAYQVPGGRGHVSGAGGGPGAELDPDRPDRTAGREPLEPLAGVRTTTLAERGGARAARDDLGRRRERVIVGVRAVRGGGHVRWVPGRGAGG